MPRRRAPSPLLLSLFPALLAACIDREVTAVEVAPDSVEQKLVPASVNRELDILFVIDNSQSMTEERRALVRDFPRMLSHLDKLDGGLPDLHVGVVTSDLGTAPYRYDTCNATGGDGGRLHGRACAALGGHAFLSDVRGVDGERVRNYGGTIADAFACMADVGAGGCGFEQHLAAMERALSPEINPDFLRRDAVLAIVIIADEDDCSVSDPGVFAHPETRGDFGCHAEGITCDDDPDPAAPGAKHNCRPNDASRYLTRVDHFVAALAARKGDLRKVVVVGMVGDPAPVVVGRDSAGRPSVLATCPAGGLGASEPGLRFKAFFDQFEPTQRSVDSLCTADLAGPLDRAGIVIGDRIGFTCLDHELIDRNPRRDGLQPECAVIEQAGDRDTVVPACELDGAARPCWRVAPDAVNCDQSVQHLRVDIDRSEAAPPGAYLSIQCVVR